MISSFYTSSVGTMQLQKGMDVISNNIANVSTVGYRPSQVSFADLLYTNIQGNNTLMAGHGAKLQKTDVLGLPGAPISTGRVLDYALVDSNCFFGILTNEGMKYTRAGNFELSQGADGQFYLASPLGGLVADANGQPIVVDPDTINDQTANLPIGVFAFDNTDGLMRDSNNMYINTVASGAPRALEEPALRSRCLEASAVSIAEEMSSVIQLQRAFQLNTRMVQVSDEIMQTINALRA